VRPTSGRVRTSLFSILGPAIEGARVVDLFAGCGALGLEALSRGAAFCCFVESAHTALAALEENLARSRLADEAELLRHDAFSVVPRLEARPPFDLAFLDPPYARLRKGPSRLVRLAEQLGASAALAAGALVVVQHDSRTSLPGRIGRLETTDHRLYGATALTFLEAPSPTPVEEAD